MKFNWGTGITIAIMMFMAFIIAMVIKMTSTQADLYAPDYYNQEIEFQQKIDARNNTTTLAGIFNVEIISEALKINFPEEFNGNNPTGTIHLYRPDNASLDKIFQVNTLQNQQYIPLELLINGHYTLKITCILQEQEYYYEKEIII